MLIYKGGLKQGEMFGILLYKFEVGGDNVMNKDFPLNRFDFSKLIEYILENETLPNIISDDETGIEFYGGNTVSRDFLVHFLEDFYIIDNLAQNDSEQEYKRNTQLGVKNFQFEPSWVDISSDKVIVGYVGVYINTDFSLIFTRINDVWTLVK